MTTAVVPSGQTTKLALACGVDDAQAEVLRRLICKDATDEEIMLFVHRCRSSGFDPLAGQVFMVKRKDHKSGTSVAFQTSIDGFRSSAESTGEYAGNDEPVFAYEPGDKAERRPIRATVTVYKMLQGQRVPFTATARWDEFYPGDGQGFMWKKMPHVMLGKCAEAQALRKAFPKRLAGLYIGEELDRVGGGPVPARVGTAERLNARLLPAPAAPRPASTGSTRNPSAATAAPAAPAAPSLDECVEKMLTAFAELGHDTAQVLEWAGRDTPADITEEDLEELRATYNECRAGAAAAGDAKED